jgi:hypothetical protein
MGGDFRPSNALAAASTKKKTAEPIRIAPMVSVMALSFPLFVKAFATFPQGNTGAKRQTLHGL